METREATRAEPTVGAEDRPWLEEIVAAVEQRYDVIAPDVTPPDIADRYAPALQAYWRLYGALKEVLRRQTLDDRLIDALMPRAIPSADALLQARRNAQARYEFLKEYGLTSDEVATIVGSRAENRAALASRWYSDGRVLRVEHNGITYYPRFQFDKSGNAHPVIRKLLKVRSPLMSDWQFALWFVAANGWLGGERPVDSLEKDADRVIDAAQHATEDLTF